jgi:hypothetical protein
MPNRILRDWTDSEKVDLLSVHAERFFTRLIMKVDDYGRFSAGAKVVRAALFPLKSHEIREADISRWLTECEAAGLIILYEINEKSYLEICNFKQRLRQMIEKYPSNSKNDGHTTDIRQSDDGLKQKPETRNQKKLHTAFAADSESDLKLKGIYDKIDKNKSSIFQFIKVNNPTFIEPYIDFWNLFAKEKSLSPVTKISDSRKRKFSVRVRENGFNFIEVLRKAGTSDFLLTGKWFGFDWIIANDSNYLKVIEGNYDAKNGFKNVQQKREIVL